MTRPSNLQISKTELSIIKSIFQIGRTMSKTSTSGSKKSPNDSATSSPDITSRCSINHNNNNVINNNNLNNNGKISNANNNGNGPIAMSETSDDSSLNSVDLDPMGKLIDRFSDQT